MPAIVSIELVFPIRTHRRSVRIHLGAEVAERDKRLGLAGVLESHAGFRAVLRAEVFVFGQLVEADKLRAVQGLAVDAAFALHADQAVSATVFDSASHSWLDGQFFGGEELETADPAINNPSVQKTFFARVGH